MIIWNTVITLYTICTFSIVFDEIWNIKNPRPLPQKKYYALNWEYKDFISTPIKGEWVLRRKRKTDSPLKQHVRKEYWKERDVLQHK